MAEDVVQAPSAPAAAQPAPSGSEPAHSSAYFFRFSIAYALLGLVAAAGVAALVVVLRSSHDVGQPRWSAFKPTGSPVAVELQIATRVSSEYKASTAAKLVNVVPGPLQATRFVTTSSTPVSVEVPITSIAVQPDVSTGKHEPGSFTSLSAGSTVAYQMCGFGDSKQNCGVVSSSGTSPARLLRREALELSLYTLRYLPGTNAVLTYLPPPASSQASPTAVLIMRKDVQGNLSRPLTGTLTPQRVLLGEAVPDAAQVNELTRSRRYTYDFQTLPGDGTAILVLTPVVTGQ